jgi:hypothetical protein
MLAEQIIAHLTLERLLLGKVRLTRSAIDSVARLNSKLKKQFEEFIDTDSFKKPDLKPKNTFSEARERVVAEFGVEELAGSLGILENVSLALDVGERVVRAAEYMKTRLPRLPVRSRPQEPSDFIASEFMRVWRTVSEPLSVVDDVLAGCLSHRQVATLKEVYPDLYQMISDAAVEAVADKLSKEPEFILPYPKLKQLSVLLEQKLVQEDLKSVLQASFVGEKATKDETKPGTAPDIANSTATSVQKLDFDL